MQYKLALLAEENIILDTLLGPKPEMVELPLEPIYEEIIVGASAQSEREREREREREERPQRAAENELAKQMPTANWSPYYVWWQTVAIVVSQNRISTLPKHRGRRSPHP